MKKNYLRLLFASAICLGIANTTTIVQASPQDDIAALQTQIDTLKQELDQVNTILNEKENNLNNTKHEIEKRTKALETVENNITETNEKTDEEIEDLAEQLSTKIIESQTNSLFGISTEITKLNTHPLSYSILNNKEKSVFTTQIETAILQETKNDLDNEAKELEETKNIQESETYSINEHKTNIESNIANLEKQISDIKAEQERIRLEQERIARLKSKYGISVSGKNSDVIETALQYLGVPYVWGGSSPSGFDCSGFVQYVYRKHGVSLTRTTYTQIYDGVPVSRSELQPGDLVFPNDGHVQLYLGNGKVIHAPQTGDVIKISPLGSVWKAVRVR